MRGRRTYRSYSEVSHIAVLAVMILFVSSSILVYILEFQMTAFAQKEEKLLQTADTSNNKSKAIGESASMSLFTSLMNSTNNNNKINNATTKEIDRVPSSPTAGEPLMSSMMNPANLMASTINQMRDSAARSKNTTSMNGSNSAGDSITILLSHQIIPANDFILLYSSKNKIINGHITAKLPCNTNSSSGVNIFVGKMPNLKPIPVDIIKDMSKPGYMCMYNANIASTNLQREETKDNATTSAITDIALANPTKEREVLLDTSTLVIGIN
jgi:hypothetical protein